MHKTLEKLAGHQNGHILLESMIALIAVGTIAFMIVNSDLVPGLSGKWNAVNNALQNKWIH